MLPDPCDRWCRVWKKMSKSGCILVQNSGHIIIGLHYNSYTGISWKLQVLAYKFLMKETNKGKQNLWHLKCAGMHYVLCLFVKQKNRIISLLLCKFRTVPLAHHTVLTSIGNIWGIVWRSDWIRSLSKVCHYDFYAHFGSSVQYSAKVMNQITVLA